jgi:UDP-N-acetylglucosamine transferase subunit ALG13
MMFVTVGAQMPFDRLIRAVDQWAGAMGRDDVFAQIGDTPYRPEYIRWAQFLPPDQFKLKFEEASVIVAHAGTGSIITALQMGKPVLIMPRQASLHETRNDHQIATSQYFRKFDSVLVATDEGDLPRKLQILDSLRAAQSIGAGASPELVSALREFIDGAG